MSRAKKILLVSHYTQTPGMVDKYFDYCKRHGYETAVIKNPLFPHEKLPSKLLYSNKEHQYAVPNGGQFFFEGFRNFTTFRHALPRFSPDAAICFDPLSFINIFFLRRLYGVKKIVYYNLDYSRHRFANPFLNLCYTWINRFAYYKSDYFVYLLDTFIQDVDPKGKHAEKNIPMKHPVELQLIHMEQQKKEHSIVYAGSLLYSVKFDNLLKALARLQKEKIPFVFDIYGRLQDTKALQKQVEKLRLDAVVRFYDVVENAILVRELLPQYYIGVCPYVSQADAQAMDHMFHGNDLTSKLVEYIAAGLPIITTPLFSAFTMIEKHAFGILVTREGEWYEALKQLLTDTSLRTKYAKNARMYAKRYDEEQTITPLFEKVLSK